MSAKETITCCLIVFCIGMIGAGIASDAHRMGVSFSMVVISVASLGVAFMTWDNS